MKKKVALLLSVSIIIIKMMVLTSCAGIIPPNGGPKDTIPPKLVIALPMDSATNVKTQKIVLTFDEFVDIKDAQQSVIVSPNPKSSPLIDYRLKNVLVKLRDSLEPNTTYSINFGNSIKDINEGNIFKEFTYVFSTGPKIADGRFSGKVVLAESGKTDSTLLVILQNNLKDTAIYKSRPRYITRVNTKGGFSFKYLEPGVYNAFVLPNDYTKRYDDSTKMFAFLDSSITVFNTTPQVTFYAFEEEKRKEKKTAPSNANNKNAVKEDKRLKFTSSLEGSLQDLLSNLTIKFSRKLKALDSSKIILCDSSFTPLDDAKISLDTSSTTANINYDWKEDNYFRLIIMKDAVMDTNGVSLLKGDTIKFSTKKEIDYGSVRLKFFNLNLKEHPVLQILSADKIEESVPLTSNLFKRKLFKPGDYSVRILLDADQNGIWTPGNYKKRRQPEIVLDKNWKVVVKANWDNETDIKL